MRFLVLSFAGRGCNCYQVTDKRTGFITYVVSGNEGGTTGGKEGIELISYRGIFPHACSFT